MGTQLCAGEALQLSTHSSFLWKTGENYSRIYKSAVNTLYLKVPDKEGIKRIIFLISAKKIHCGYSLEAPWKGASNVYPQHIVFKTNKKKIFILVLKKHTPKNLIWIYEIFVPGMTLTVKYFQENIMIQRKCIR